MKLIRDALAKRDIQTTNVAIDATGGGDPFSAILAREIGHGFINVQFGGRPSDIAVSSTDKRTGRERFANQVSELWGILPTLNRAQQLRGITPDLITELSSRLFDDSSKLKVEAKDEMKKRTGKSPDLGDSFALLCHVCRMKHGLSSTERAKPGAQRRQGSFQEMIAKVFGATEGVGAASSGWAE